MPAYRLLAVAALVGAALAVYQAFAQRLLPIVWAIALYVVVARRRQRLRAASSSASSSAPNEQVRETPYIVNNITATREAFGLDKVEERPLSGDARLSRADLERNAATIENVPLWNEQPLLDTFGQIQEIRTYYDFVSVDNDRYIINGKYRQIMLSARELNSRSLPSRTWINEQLTFTHGYGLTLGPVNEVTPEGLPVLFIRDLPLTSTVDLKVTQPAIYFGELPETDVFVKTKTEEFDYPRGDDNVFATYQGNGGVPLGGLFRRLHVRDPLPLDRHVLLADADAREPRDDAPAHQRARRRDRAVPDLRPRSVPRHHRRAGWCGSRTPTRRAIAIPTRAPPAASTTSATPSRSRSTPITARRPSTCSIRTTRSRQRSAASSPPSSSRSTTCPRTCGSACATRRRSSRCRRRCSRPST